MNMRLYICDVDTEKFVGTGGGGETCHMFSDSILFKQ